MGRFWVEDDFIDNYAKKLSCKAQIVYICLKRHANNQAISSIGSRKIAEKLGIDRSTAKLALQELEVGGFTTQWSYKVGGFRSRGGRKLHPLQGGNTDLKELGIITKEENLKNKEEKLPLRGLEQLRVSLKGRGLLR